MWRKEAGKSSEPQPSAAQPDFAEAPAGVAQGIKIKGEITGQGDFSVHGEVDGKISIGSGTLTVAPHSLVRAEIQARQVEIHGEVVGSLKACERVHVWSTGKMTGDMETRGIVIDDGAVLHSKVRVAQDGAQTASAEAATTAASTEAAKVSEPLQRAKSTGA
jgi:cytoskeletal protein CcmA (bactofilin family)